MIKFILRPEPAIGVEIESQFSLVKILMLA